MNETEVPSWLWRPCHPCHPCLPCRPCPTVCFTNSNNNTTMYVTRQTRSKLQSSSRASLGHHIKQHQTQLHASASPLLSHHPCHTHHVCLFGNLEDERNVVWCWFELV